MKTLFALLTLIALTFTTHAERLVLVGVSYGKNLLAITDADGKVIWQYKTAGPQRGHTGHHDVHLLPNGNILFHDTWTKTQEITLGKKIVWSYESAQMNGNAGKRVDVHAFARLKNGNTMIVESSVGRVIEVDQAGKLAHQFPLKPGGTQSTRWARHTATGTLLACSERPAWLPNTIAPVRWSGITSSTRASTAPSVSKTATPSSPPAVARASWKSRLRKRSFGKSKTKCPAQTLASAG